MFIERFIIVVIACSFLVTVGLIIFNFLKRKQALQLLTVALKVNTVKELENLLIVYDKNLDNNIKQKVRARIDDLVIEEDERELSLNFNCKTNKDINE